MRILAFETSCDDTCVCLLDTISRKYIHRRKLHEENLVFQGVVPNISARSHSILLGPLTVECLQEGGLSLEDIDVFGVTKEPGLKICLQVGLDFAKMLSVIYKKPLIEVNHLYAHIKVGAYFNNVTYPALGLLLSGGHSLFILCHSDSSYEILGSTLDDSLGECFDKCGREIGLDYPAGPAMEKLAMNGKIIPNLLPFPYLNDSLDFSFSGLKTAFKKLVNSYSKEDLARTFHFVVSKTLGHKLIIGLKKAREIYPELSNILLVGGVSANRIIYNDLQNIAREEGGCLFSAPIEFCGDNALMVALLVEDYSK